MKRIIVSSTLAVATLYASLASAKYYAGNGSDDWLAFLFWLF